MNALRYFVDVGWIYVNGRMHEVKVVDEVNLHTFINDIQTEFLRIPYITMWHICDYVLTGCRNGTTTEVWMGFLHQNSFCK